MPVFEVTQDTVSEFPILLVDSAGNAVTGVLKTQVTPYLKKAGGSFTLVPQADFDWNEEDATNCPGHYTLTMNATGIANNRLDTLGSLQLVLPERTTAPAYIQYPLFGYVVPMVYWEVLRRLRGWGNVNYRLFPTVWNSVHGEIEAATVKIYPTQADADADTNAIETGTLTAVFDVDGLITSYKLTVA
jgi:hypothetical protein